MENFIQNYKELLVDPINKKMDTQYDFLNTINELITLNGVSKIADDMETQLSNYLKDLDDKINSILKENFNSTAKTFWSDIKKFETNYIKKFNEIKEEKIKEINNSISSLETQRTEEAASGDATEVQGCNVEIDKYKEALKNIDKEVVEAVKTKMTSDINNIKSKIEILFYTINNLIIYNDKASNIFDNIDIQKKSKSDKISLKSVFETVFKNTAEIKDVLNISNLKEGTTDSNFYFIIEPEIKKLSKATIYKEGDKKYGIGFECDGEQPKSYNNNELKEINNLKSINDLTTKGINLKNVLEAYLYINQIKQICGERIESEINKYENIYTSNLEKFETLKKDINELINDYKSEHKATEYKMNFEEYMCKTFSEYLTKLNDSSSIMKLSNSDNTLEAEEYVKDALLTIADNDVKELFGVASDEDNATKLKQLKELSENKVVETDSLIKLEDNRIKFKNLFNCLKVNNEIIDTLAKYLLDRVKKFVDDNRIPHPFTSNAFLEDFIINNERNMKDYSYALFKKSYEESNRKLTDYCFNKFLELI